MKPTFIRTDSFRFSKLGKNRKKLQKWRAAKGKHSKIRRRRKGYPAIPIIGYKSSNNELGKIDGKTPVLIQNLSQIDSLDKNSVVIIARALGAKKKLEAFKKLSEKGIKVINAGGKK